VCVNSHQSAETEGVDSQEQFYEVPHWMHLSFVSYESNETVFANHVHDLGASEEMKKIAISAPQLEIGANGFLCPKPGSGSSEAAAADASPLLGPTSFSARGNAAASPVRKAKDFSNERQLITGRDFRDILEACRPRNASFGILPSALKALLRINGLKNDQSNLNEAGVNSRSKNGVLFRSKL